MDIQSKAWSRERSYKEQLHIGGKMVLLNGGNKSWRGVSPIKRIKILIIAMSLTSVENWSIHQMDVKLSF